MKFWPRLIMLLFLIVLLAFAGARLVGMMFDVLRGVGSSGSADGADPQWERTEPTSTPPAFTDQDYDAVQGVPEG